ncbi:hypothetical protein C8C77_13631 [Halanaerobium saccharolyticum]|uniref:Uncharacterized protein n=1 Tax=Halanaerobium saccharolyticum TaxID=43595 RepID=A0A4R7YRG0_9FIRM|nr:hypothetical protein [Halanaerobium saccharolyticum]RAK05000.1 hypothetical protein C7958_13231 [Halanaerobium saccharolyticum]TDV98354.1 hypothetical protein C8C77_13631 [Halanaerobium saccharolyticum]TDX51352.1 hypothetical protein C7956_13531 [Halanaerobium saccharolyticum]
MDLYEIRSNLLDSMKDLYFYDFYLIKNDLNERSIMHKLGCYLKKYFNDFNIDCEYNGSVEHPDLRKKIDIYKQAGKIKRDDKEHSVYPDIIVHQRISSNFNKLIIEIKKSTNSDIEFDKEKMQFYTNENRNEKYFYEFGCLINIKTGLEFKKEFELSWYINGEQEDEELINIESRHSV